MNAEISRILFNIYELISKCLLVTALVHQRVQSLINIKQTIFNFYIQT